MALGFAGNGMSKQHLGCMYDNLWTTSTGSAAGFRTSIVKGTLVVETLNVLRKGQFSVCDDCGISGIRTHRWDDLFMFINQYFFQELVEKIVQVLKYSFY